MQAKKLVYIWANLKYQRYYKTISKNSSGVNKYNVKLKLYVQLTLEHHRVEQSVPVHLHMDFRFYIHSWESAYIEGQLKLCADF